MNIKGTTVISLTALTLCMMSSGIQKAFASMLQEDLPPVEQSTEVNPESALTKQEEEELYFNEENVFDETPPG